MKKLLILLTAATMLSAQTINIAVAANVSYAIKDLIQAFKQTHQDINVRVMLGSSGKLTAQIKNGAPYNMFMSANMKYPQALYNQGLAITKPVVYAQGTLAYLSSLEKDFSQGMKLLTDPKIEKIAVANPKTAPYGTAALEAIKNANLYEKVKDKLVYAESIAQTVTYTLTATQLGFIAKSSLYSQKMQKYEKGKHWYPVATSLYTPIDQGIVILKDAKGNKAVQALYEFMLSKQAKAIFKEYGYIVK